VELERQRDALRERGLEVAAVSYDSVAVLGDFATRRKITFPLLSDEGSAIIRRFGLLNPEYAEGNNAHGVPYPGTFVTDARGVIRSKYFEKTYVERRTAASLLTLAGEAPASAQGEVRNDHFVLKTSASNAQAAPGQRVTLVLDFAMADKRHAYAPGATGYRPLALRVEPDPLFTAHDAVLPAARPYFFAPLKETVPVFEGRFRVLQDVTLAGGRDFAALLKQENPTLAISARLDFQVCSETVCYPPASLPLRFSLRVLPLDRERVPESLQRKPTK
jgi:hypothetical protein